ncbi:5'-methylthioadenosine/S-adenosylhomocysteine nucleosidase 2 [Dichanthelium oligosanthes]|uniref:5'-methylthioadenosine/S-adenosylhomocysteine nucleosidase 2 n=1 Tax=Dichanthelium oligosanthes TaxID=888268 RepID=A0A1E5UWV0_9POAL|nr:5'-methylthioadenosine/S-adenosylhomocysteine nucleosidase 2 [Dichanthelium oligosanthes]
MAPPPPPSEQPEAAAAGAGAITKVLIVMAMEKEAMPLVNEFKLVRAEESIFPKGATWTRFHGNYKDLHIDLVMPGKDVVFGVDSVGTVSAALVTYASIQALKPDFIINAGTAGGFKARGASIKDVFLASDVAFHDRRIPIPLGKLSTGDSLDMSPEDEAAILSNDATIKDMEGAAVAYVADMFSTPAIFVKAVTDIVDGDKPTAEEFLNNLISVTEALGVAVTKVVDFINGKCISDL